MINTIPQAGAACTQCGYIHFSSTCPTDSEICAWYESQSEEWLASLSLHVEGITPRKAWNFFFCPSPATQTTGESLAALAGGGQGADTSCHGDDSGLVHAARRIEPFFPGHINVDDLVHCALSEVFGKLHEEAGFSIEEANKAIYQSLDRLGYFERGKAPQSRGCRL